MIKINSFVYYEHPNTDYVVNHKHEQCECIFFLEGKAMISTKNVVYTLSAPTIAMIPSQVVHDEKEITNTKMFIVLFTQEEEINEVTITSLSPEQNEKILNIFDEIYALEKKGEDYQKQCSLFALVISLLQAFKFLEKEDSEQMEIVEFSKTFIEKNYALDVDYKSLATSYGYSYSRFRHIFKNIVGVSPHQYCLSLRLSNAKKLLKETNYPINKISRKCGFMSDAAFDIFFKKEMNVAPNQFRRLVQSQEEGAVVTMEGAK